MRYLEEIRRECTVQGCFRVLIEERLEGPRLGIMDVFQIAADGSSRAGPTRWSRLSYTGRTRQDRHPNPINQGLAL
jgi:hypothetical protein